MPDPSPARSTVASSDPADAYRRALYRAALAHDQHAAEQLAALVAECNASPCRRFVLAWSEGARIGGGTHYAGNLSIECAVSGLCALASRTPCPAAVIVISDNVSGCVVALWSYAGGLESTRTVRAMTRSLTTA
jgi:hypothetical protein